MCSGFLCLACGPVTLELMILFTAFNLWIGPGFISALGVNF
jgi:hypothetical protein